MHHQVLQFQRPNVLILELRWNHKRHGIMYHSETRMVKLTIGMALTKHASFRQDI